MKNIISLLKSKEFVRLIVSISLAAKLAIISNFLCLGEIGERIILSFLIFTIFHAVTFLVIRFFYSGIYDYIHKYFTTENMKAPKEMLSIFHKSVIIISIIAVYLFSLIVIFSVI